jgi:hypothetical protein
LAFPVTCHLSPVTPFGWRLAGLDFFGTPRSIDQKRGSDQVQSADERQHAQINSESIREWIAQKGDPDQVISSHR